MAQEAKKDIKPKLGETLVEHGIITSNMLKNALKRQTQVGGHLGSLLIEMGYLTTDDLLDFLSKQFGVPAVNLFNVKISKDALQTLPLEKMKEYRALPIEMDEKTILAMINPKDYSAIGDIELILGKRVNPAVALSWQMEAAFKLLGSEGLIELKGCDIEKVCINITDETDIKTLLERLVESRAIDLQLTAGAPPSLKMGTELQRLNIPPLTPELMSIYAGKLMTEEQQKSFDVANDLDFAFTDVVYGRFRVNIYKQRNSVSITLRRIPDQLPDLKSLGVPEDLESYVLKTQGLILITGPAGHGKSTTLAALVDIINTKRKCNIITLEDPIEYLHKHKYSNVNQREIGIDTASFHEGLKHVFRQSPDVIVIGEMRDPDSFIIALQAAETGHLVLSTVCSRNATSTIERVIDTFPPHHQPQIRTQLADSLLLILGQRLVSKKDRSGLVLAHEKLTNNYKIKNFIREGKTHQIRSQMLIPGEDYSSIDVSLAKLAVEGIISAEEGARQADNLSFYQDMLKAKGTK